MGKKPELNPHVCRFLPAFHFSYRLKKDFTQIPAKFITAIFYTLNKTVINLVDKNTSYCLLYSIFPDICIFFKCLCQYTGAPLNLTSALRPNSVCCLIPFVRLMNMR